MNEARDQESSQVVDTELRDLWERTYDLGDEGNFAAIDRILQEFDVTHPDPAMLYAVGSYTYRFRHFLPSWCNTVTRVADELESRGEEAVFERRWLSEISASGPATASADYSEEDGAWVVTVTAPDGEQYEMVKTFPDREAASAAMPDAVRCLSRS